MPADKMGQIKYTVEIENGSDTSENGSDIKRYPTATLSPKINRRFEEKSLSP